VHQFGLTSSHRADGEFGICHARCHRRHLACELERSSLAVSASLRAPAPPGEPRL